jgi:Ca2+-binding RTX toxin-like protein
MMLAAMAVMVTLFAAAAYAAILIEGTSEGEGLNESNVADDIFGRGGPDVINAAVYQNIGDVDVVHGNSGNDNANAADGDGFDTINGGTGRDTCRADIGDDVVRCEQ